ncbi:unnamed protein product [Caenorhabditis bovis]|uniref:Bardet-Biedl syndrome 1 N-terminal domain-containing protein n=1 Tax=Caenorhabditis bovis TaxID=2654633 RepID=A0A8S1FD53_9PELO|nr:unnamed protein product [Caenorhabditis bovis]
MENFKSKWTAAVNLTNCEIHCASTCVALGDLFSDGDSKLIVAHGGHRGLNMKLKVFKGVAPFAESSLADMPTAIIHFINELSSLPSIAVAAGPSLLIYKNLKPFYKFTVPSSPVNAVEQQAWQAAGSKQIGHDELITVLGNLANEISFTSLSPLSQTLLLTPASDRQFLIERYIHKPISNSASITCVAKMEKSSAEVIDVLLIGTEHNALHIIDSQAFTILSTCILPSVPVSICTHGTYEVDYRLFVLTRDSRIFSIRREQKTADKPIITSPELITSFVRLKKFIAIATSDNRICFYTFKGKKMNQVKCEKKIRLLERFEYKQKQYAAVIAMFDNELRLYDEGYMLDILKFDKTLSWIKFGNYGREEGALVICFKDGSVCVRMFRRLANFDEKMDFNPRPPVHSIKLQIPKKTKVFIDQTVREKDNAGKINQAYQKDLFLLRCRIAEVFSDLTASAHSVVSNNAQIPIDISVDIHGFGPSFRMTIYVVSKTNLYNMWLSAVCDPGMYNFDSPLIPVSFLSPGHKYSYTTLLTCKDPEKATQEEIRVILVHQDRPTPIVTALIKMPISEFAID